MRVPLIRTGLLIAVIVAAPASAQDSSALLEAGSGGEAPAISPLRLAAGVREYPARVLRSLLLVAEEPLVLRQLADEPDLLERPGDISPPVPPEMHAAIRELSVMPAIVAVSADHPEELSALRELYAEAPEAMEERILQLRAAYDQAELGAAIAWQEALQRDPAALEAYCALVTRFCKAQREAYEGFPCVQVLKREYYYACPPNEAIIFYAIEQAESSVAMQVIEQWWQTYAPYERDARILGGGMEPLEFEVRPDSVAAMPPAQRASMWQAVEGNLAGLVDLVPVIMQPPADQPPEAYYARAVAEHARLWTPEMPLEVPEEPAAGAFEGPAAGWLVGDEGDGLFVDDWQYVEEPVEEVIYEDDDWDYASGWAYGPTAYSRVSYRWHRAYYEPIAVYYCGYPVDWPLFYGCDPWWLLRLRICVAYVRCGYGADGYYGWSRWCEPRHVVRVGRRHYYRCRYNQIAHFLRHRGTHHRWSHSRPGLGSRHAQRAALDAAFGVPRTGSRQDGHGRHISTAGAARARPGRANALSHSVISNLPSAASSGRQRTTSGTRSGVLRPPARAGTPKRHTFDRPGNVSARPEPALRPSSSGRGPSNGVDRASRSRPKTSEPKIVVPRRSSTENRPASAAPRRSTSPRPKTIVSPRPSSSPRRSSSPAARPATSSKPKSAVSSRGSSGSRRSSAVSSGRSTSSKPKSAVSPRPSSSPRRSSSSAARPATSSKPKSAVSPRGSSGSRRSSGVSSGRSTSSKPKSAVSPRPSSSSRPRSGVSSRRSTSSKPKSAASPRPSSSPRRSSSPAARPATSSKPKSSASSRRSSSSRPRSGVSSRRSTSSKPKSAASSR
jgi:hypothetical protein